jgi:hypothetical protein
MFVFRDQAHQVAAEGIGRKGESFPLCQAIITFHHVVNPCRKTVNIEGLFRQGNSRDKKR